MLDDVGAVAVDFEPGERFVERRAVEQAALGAMGRLDVEQPVLQAENLLQPLDVAPRDRQQAELDAALERIGREALPAADQAERLQQRAGEDRVGQRVGRAFELRAIAIERRDRAPQQIGRVVELRRDLLQQAGRVQLTEGFLGMPRAQNLEVLLEQPRRRAPRDLVLVAVDGVEDRVLDGELEPRREHDRPQHPDRILEEPHVRIADAADHPRVQILEAADVVDDRERADVVEQRVDREVAAERVFFGRAVGVVALDEPIALAARVQVVPFGILRRLLVSPAAGSAASTSASSVSGVDASTCRRNVATSMVLVPNLTCASRKRRPMIQQLRKSFLTWCGCADVPMSKSFGRRSSSRSRTLPPTRYAT